MTRTKIEAQYVHDLDIFTHIITAFVTAMLLFFRDWLMSSPPVQCALPPPCPPPCPVPQRHSQKLFTNDWAPVLGVAAVGCIITILVSASHILSLSKARAMTLLIVPVPIFVLWARAACGFSAMCFNTFWMIDFAFLQLVAMATLGLFCFFAPEIIKESFENTPTRWVILVTLVITYVLWLVEPPQK
jgi:hypothetical protein